MCFVHTAYDPDDTCAAIATPPGNGGIHVVRISGKNSVEIASKVFSGPVMTYESHTVHYGKCYHPQGRLLDDVLLLVMRAPRSFTGDDTVEIHCHGGALIAKEVLEACFVAGARPAKPGEFTFKAFMNGKIDLSQAEAIQAKIAAQNELMLSCANEQMQGLLSRRVQEWQKALFHIAAIFEAWVDFPEEGLEFSSFDVVQAQIQEVVDDMQKLIDSYCKGRIIAEGIAVAIVGCPNVGKSSLLNALLGKERSIVSDIAGTTRDIVEDALRLNGLHLRLIDTAGIRETIEEIEKEGIRRSQQAIDQSDIVLLVLDATQAHVKASFYGDLPKEKTIVIWNKVDLEHVRPLPELDFPSVVEVSAKASLGLDAISREIDAIIWQKGARRQEEAILTSIRHKEALESSVRACLQVLNGLEAGVSCEFIAYDMREALHALGTIIGTNITDEILTQVFSSFCLGK